MESRIDHKVYHPSNIDSIKKKCWNNSDLARGKMREILRIPLGAKDRYPHCIYREKESESRNKEKKNFEHNNYISSIL